MPVTYTYIYMPSVRHNLIFEMFSESRTSPITLRWYKLSDLSRLILLHYLKLVQYVRSTQEALVRHFNIWIIQISTSCSDNVKILTYMRQIIHEHSHVHCVSPRLLEVTHSPLCPGFNRSTLVAAGRYYAHHSSQSLNSHSINICKPHISQAKLKNPLGVVFFPRWRPTTRL